MNENYGQIKAFIIKILKARQIKGMTLGMLSDFIYDAVYGWFTCPNEVTPVPVRFLERAVKL